MPFAFNEQGVVLLSEQLYSDTTIQVNITIIRAFVAIRYFTSGYTELNKKLEEYIVDNHMRIAETLDIFT